MAVGGEQSVSTSTEPSKNAENGSCVDVDGVDVRQRYSGLSNPFLPPGRWTLGWKVPN